MEKKQSRVRKQVHPNSRKRVNTRGLSRRANDDTPMSVNIPDSLQGVALWALGRFGVAVVFCYAAYIFYQDQRSDAKLTREDQILMRQAFEKGLNDRAADREDRAKDRVLMEKMIQALDRNTQVVENLGKTR